MRARGTRRLYETKRTSDLGVGALATRKMDQWIEEGDLHFFETPDGEALVCGRSLSMKMDELDSTTNRLSGRNASAR